MEKIHVNNTFCQIYQHTFTELGTVWVITYSFLFGGVIFTSN